VFVKHIHTDLTLENEFNNIVINKSKTKNILNDCEHQCMRCKKKYKQKQNTIYL
jgi:hypothetical protein